MVIKKEKSEEIQRRMERLGITDDDIVEKFILGSGSGGQKVNKTSSCVYLKHIPTGTEVKCQRERSRELNRYIARRELCEKLEEKLLNEKSKKRQAAEKVRRQKRRRSRRSQAKMLEDKKLHGEKKGLRQKPSQNGEGG